MSSSDTVIYKNNCVFDEKLYPKVNLKKNVDSEIYWSEAAPSGKIGRTTSDGSDQSYLITSGLQNPTDISIDSTGNYFN